MATLTYKCPNCDGGLQFDPKTQDFACEYCLSHFTQTQLDALNPALEKESTSALPKDTPVQQKESQGEAHYAVVYSCPSCGAEVVTEDTTAATFCYYCHNPVVLQGRLDGNFTPDRVIPFAITREQATKSFLDWASKKWFVPKAFFGKEQIEKLTGVYYPYWTADFDLHSSLDAHGTQVRVWRSGNTEYTETRHFRIVREGDLSFDELMRNALNKADHQLAEGILPFDFSKAKEFNMGYLSGFLAEKRDIERAEVEGNVEDEAKNYAQNLLRETAVGYATVIPKFTQSEVKKSNWHYVLLPVWVLTYKGRDGNMYYYAMNGQNGKVCGKLPLDRGRMLALFAGVSVPLYLLLLLGGWLL